MNNNSDYERIKLSKQELKYIYTQILNETTEKLNLHLPASNGDPLKSKVATVLDEFLLGAFDLAKSAFVIDGIDMGADEHAETPINDILSPQTREVVEPFDSGVNKRLRDVLLNVEQETVQLTKLRRELPVRAKQAYLDLVSRTDKEVSTILEELERLANAEQGQEDEDTEKAIANIEDISQDYESHILILNELKRTIPVRRAELDSINETIQFLEKAYNHQQKELN
ncbi:kinetochore protein Mis14 like-domain-containing protein [Scheffersomyces xylosifermentans]|uniref:kinetochore protein Mis14 like-domain-containing protein n=1 Tax=Scheffersomyces xylosifermentans TaxID=1304137 RepID=UPI00315DD05C